MHGSASLHAGRFDSSLHTSSQFESTTKGAAHMVDEFLAISGFGGHRHRERVETPAEPGDCADSSRSHVRTLYRAQCVQCPRVELLQTKTPTVTQRPASKGSKDTVCFVIWQLITVVGRHTAWRHLQDRRTRTMTHTVTTAMIWIIVTN